MKFQDCLKVTTARSTAYCRDYDGKGVGIQHNEGSVLGECLMGVEALGLVKLEKCYRKMTVFTPSRLNRHSFLTPYLRPAKEREDACK